MKRLEPIRAAACDLEHRARFNALVDQMPGDPDAVWSLFDDAGYELQIEGVVRCCRARLALDAAKAAVGMAA